MATSLGFKRILKFAARRFGAEEEETAQACIALLCFFCILSSFYLLLPLRDELGLRIGIPQRHQHSGLAGLGTSWLPTLFVGSLFATAMTAPLTSAYLCRKMEGKTQRLRRLYLFVATVLSGFVFAFSMLQPRFQSNPHSSSHPVVWSLSRVDVVVYCSFYIWVGVQNVISISSLWARCADVFSKDSAEKLFGCISVGSTFGQLFGSSMARWLLGQSDMLRNEALGYQTIVASAVCMAAASWFASKLHGDMPDQIKQDRGPSTSIQFLDGFRSILKSRYLLLICLYVMGSYAVATQFYFEKVCIAEAVLESYKQRASWFATLNLYSGIVIAFLQLIVTGRILTTLPLWKILFLTPAVCALGMTSVTIHSVPSTIGIAEVMRKIVTFAFGRPARETLFTVVDSEEKYKAKLIIDAVFQRVGDVIGAALFHGLRSSFSLSPKVIAAFAVSLSLLWGVVGISLAKTHQKMTTL